ncbi:hypothetical protein SRHO_G00222410 [Serrasalmus rhombeus]
MGSGAGMPNRRGPSSPQQEEKGSDVGHSRLLDISDPYLPQRGLNPRVRLSSKDLAVESTQQSAHMKLGNSEKSGAGPQGCMFQVGEAPLSSAIYSLLSSVPSPVYFTSHFKSLLVLFTSTLSLAVSLAPQCCFARWNPL